MNTTSINIIEKLNNLTGSKISSNILDNFVKNNKLEDHLEYVGNEVYSLLEIIEK